MPDRLARQLAFLEANPRVAAVGGALIRIDETGTHGATMTFPTADRGIRSTLARRSCISHSAALIRRDALEQAGGYRLNEAEDFDLWLRLSEGWQLANLVEPVLLYREHPGQVTLTTIERQVTATMAAHASARARRAGRHDPLAAATELDAETLAQLELGPAEIAARVTRDCLERAASYELLGHHDQTAALLAIARTTLGPRTDRTFAAALALKRADAHLAAHRPLAAVATACLGVFHAPRYASGRLLARARDRFNGRTFW